MKGKGILLVVALCLMVSTGGAATPYAVGSHFATYTCNWANPDFPGEGSMEGYLSYQARTDVYGIPAGEVDFVNVYLAWEVPRGSCCEHDSFSGTDEASREFQGGVGIIGGEGFSFHEDPFGTTAYIDIEHAAYSDVNNWSVHSLVQTSRSCAGGAN